jgi:hypothetical protein
VNVSAAHRRPDFVAARLSRRGLAGLTAGTLAALGLGSEIGA